MGSLLLGGEVEKPGRVFSSDAQEGLQWGNFNRRGEVIRHRLLKWSFWKKDRFTGGNSKADLHENV